MRRISFLALMSASQSNHTFAHNPSATHGSVQGNRLTGEGKYLELLPQLDRGQTRGASRGPVNRSGLCSQVSGGTDQIQDRVPVRESTEVVGHNVFFTYLYTGAGDLSG